MARASGRSFEKNLLLERDGRGADDDLLAREERGDEVREGLAGAGAGLHEEVAILRQGALDRVHHRQLTLAGLVGREPVPEGGARLEQPARDAGTRRFGPRPLAEEPRVVGVVFLGHSPRS